MSLSPRISFSQPIPPQHQHSDPSLPLDPPPSDFNFAVSRPTPAVHSSDADELFSGGKLLPFFKPPAPPGPTPRPFLADPSPAAANCRRPFWRFGRSSSVGSAAEPRPVDSPPLSRCKSAGSFPAARPGTAALRSGSGRRRTATYYFSGSRRGCLDEGGVRINPVLNVPAPIYAAGGGGGGGGGGSNGAIAGIFAYLLCDCGGEAKRDEMQDFLAGSGRSGTGIV